MTNIQNISLNRITFHEVAHASTGGPALAKTQVISDKNSFSSFFDGNAPRIDLGNIKGIVVGISLGQRPTSGYGVKICSVSQPTDGIAAGLMEIECQEIKPRGAALQVITHPYVIVAVEGTQWLTDVVVRWINES